MFVHRPRAHIGRLAQDSAGKSAPNVRLLVDNSFLPETESPMERLYAEARDNVPEEITDRDRGLWRVLFLRFGYEDKHPPEEGLRYQGLAEGGECAWFTIGGKNSRHSILQVIQLALHGIEAGSVPQPIVEALEDIKNLPPKGDAALCDKPMLRLVT